MSLGRRKKSDLKIDLNVYLEKGAYNGTAQGLKDEIDNLKSRAVGENVASEVDLSNYLEKGGYEGTAQDLKNELDNLSTKMNEATLTEEDLVELKKIATGNRFTIKYSDGTMTSTKYDELLNAVRDKQVEEISVNTDGLDNFSFNFEKRSFYVHSIFFFDDVEDGSRREDFDNSGYYLDFFDLETKQLLSRNKISLNTIFYERDSVDISKFDIRFPLNKQIFIRVMKYGNYTDYELYFKLRGVSYNSYIFRNMGVEDKELLLDGFSQSESNFSIEMIPLKTLRTTITNFFVDEKSFKSVPNLGFRFADYSGFLGWDKSSYSDSVSVGDKFLLLDFSKCSYKGGLKNCSIIINTTNKITGYYKIQLINTENQEVVFEKDNREDNTDTITLENVQLPKLLTIKLWTNESLLAEEEGAVSGD